MKKIIEDKYLKVKNYCKDREYCHYTKGYRAAAYSVFNLKYSIPNEMPGVFCNGSSYDYHFIIQESTEKLEK